MSERLCFTFCFNVLTQPPNCSGVGKTAERANSTVLLLVVMEMMENTRPDPSVSHQGKKRKKVSVRKRRAVLKVSHARQHSQPCIRCVGQHSQPCMDICTIYIYIYIYIFIYTVYIYIYIYIYIYNIYIYIYIYIYIRYIFIYIYIYLYRI